MLLGKVHSSGGQTTDITVDPSLYTGYMLVTSHWGGDFGGYLNTQSVEIGDVIMGLNGGSVVGYLPASVFKWPDYTADTYSDSSDYHMFIVQSVQTHNGGAACLGSAWWKTPNVIKLNASYGSQYVYLVGIR